MMEETITQTATIEQESEQLPYDEELYKIYFDEAKKRFPQLDDFLIHLGCVNLLMNTEKNQDRGEELQKQYFRGEIFEGIKLCPSEDA